MDAVVCVARDSRRHFVERYPELAPKTNLIHNFFDAGAVLEKGAEPYTFPGQGPVLLSVGRMTPAKQYPRFLEVLARLRDEGYGFSWHLLGEGIQRPEIEEKIRALRLEDRVFLHALTDNPYKYMRNCGLFVLPSGWEGFPTVTVEAKVLGCPVLATEVSGIREQLRHGETGWIVENSGDGLYMGLKHLLDHPELRESLRSNAGMEWICGNEEKYQAFMSLIR